MDHKVNQKGNYKKFELNVSEKANFQKQKLEGLFISSDNHLY